MSNLIFTWLVLWYATATLVPVYQYKKVSAKSMPENTGMKIFDEEMVNGTEYIAEIGRPKLILAPVLLV